jgi:hypothetical protein
MRILQCNMRQQCVTEDDQQQLWEPIGVCMSPDDKGYIVVENYDESLGYSDFDNEEDSDEPGFVHINRLRRIHWNGELGPVIETPPMADLKHPTRPAATVQLSRSPMILDAVTVLSPLHSGHIVVLRDLPARYQYYIQTYGPNEELIDTFVVPPEKVTYVHSLHVTSNGCLLLSYSDGAALFSSYRSDAKFIRHYSFDGAFASRYRFCLSAFIHEPTQRVFALDRMASCIRVCNVDGTGKCGTIESNFDQPQAMLNIDDVIVVADSDNDRVVILDISGKLLNVHRTNGILYDADQAPTAAATVLTRPTAVGLRPDGDLLVCFDENCTLAVLECQ